MLNFFQNGIQEMDRGKTKRHKDKSPSGRKRREGWGEAGRRAGREGGAHPGPGARARDGGVHPGSRSGACEDRAHPGPGSGAPDGGTHPRARSPCNDPQRPREAARGVERQGDSRLSAGFRRKGTGGAGPEGR